MTRTHIAGALAITAALLHWSCCGCEDQPLAPTVVATPTPTPAPTPTPCTIGPIPPSFRCAAEPPPRFQSLVIAAQDQVRREHPEIFDTSVRAPGTTWPGVRDFERYHQLIVQAMIGRGYCAWFDGEEVQAKRENRFSEHYDVFLGEGFVRRGEGIYRSTCYPAAF